MGFSSIGLIIAVAVFAPSLLLLALPPRRDLTRGAEVPALVALAERLGQVACLALPTFSHDAFAAAPPSAGLVVMIAALAAYYALWVRYLISGRDIAVLYRSVAGLPVPMALLPVIAFGSAALWSGSGWLGLAAIVLAIGHIPTSWATARLVDGRPPYGATSAGGG